MTKIGKLIDEQRRAKGHTQIAAAQEIGVSQSTVSRWRLGQAFPEPPQVAGLARYLSLSVDAVVGLAAEDEYEAHLRQPHVPADVVHGTPVEFGQLSGAVERLGKQVSALRRRSADLAKRVSDLEEQVAAQSPAPAPVDLRKRSHR